MPALEPALCVSMHSVCAESWARCARVLDALEASSRVPVTLLVLPEPDPPPFYRRAVERRMSAGHEPALCAEPEGQALWRGRGWFRRRRWPLHGFVPARWQMPAAAWSGLEHQPLAYTATREAFHLLHPRADIPAPWLGFPGGGRLQRLWSRVRAAALARRVAAAPLVRIELSPEDGERGAAVARAVALVEALLPGRLALTKAALAARYERLKFSSAKAQLRRSSSSAFT